LRPVPGESSQVIAVANFSEAIKSGSNTSALNEIDKALPKSKQIKIWQNKYLNNIVEQDYIFIKKITRTMLGFKSMRSARATLDGIELHHMLRKWPHKNSADQ
jgi:putative transposase